MFKHKILISLPALLASAAAVPASAAVIPVTTYDSFNGSTGSFAYWDRFYGGGDHQINGEVLTGGTGDLTDGIAASDLWYAVENGSGTGPYVGWLNSTTPNAVVVFHFAGAPVIDTISIHLDNSGSGGVSAPSAIWIDGSAASFSSVAAGTAGWATASGLNLTGSSHSIQFFYGNSWIFVSEVAFSGDGGVPEPASWAMMIGGLGLVGAAMRRRAAKVSFA